MVRHLQTDRFYVIALEAPTSAMNPTVDARFDQSQQLNWTQSIPP